MYIFPLYIILWTLGPPLLLLCNGPTSWQCSQGYLFDPMVDHVMFSLGLFSASISAQCTGWRRTTQQGHNSKHDPGNFLQSGIRVNFTVGTAVYSAMILVDHHSNSAVFTYVLARYNTLTPSLFMYHSWLAFDSPENMCLLAIETTFTPRPGPRIEMY